jgi:pyruvyltransferase
VRRRIIRKKSPDTAIPAYPTVDLTYWKPQTGGVNFGDELGYVIVALMLARKGRTVIDQASVAKQLLAVGSILHMAKDGAVIWGSGLNGNVPEENHRYSTLDVRAVRGPITRQFLAARGISAPAIYGDPALLLRELAADRFQLTGQHRVGIVPNMFDLPKVSEAPERFTGLRIIDPMRSWDVVVREILGCELILASSLHGLVVADAFGIPARYLRLSDHEPTLKYEDYFRGTGRQLAPADSIEHAIQMGGHEPCKFDAAALMGAFPYDLWEV